MELRRLLSMRVEARVPYLEFAPDFIEPIQKEEKKATTRCPGPKDTDHPSVPWRFQAEWLKRKR